MTLFLFAVALLLLSALAGALSRKGGAAMEKCSLFLVLGGCGLGIRATFFCLLHPQQAFLSLPWSLVPGAAIALKCDPLAAAFLLPALVVTAAGALYGQGYWPLREKPASGAWLRFFYPLLSASIVLLLLCDNPVLFLINWELMALSGYFLIITEREREEAHRAAFLYLIATHTGTLLLFGSFAMLMTMTPGPLLPAAGTLAGASWQAGIIFCLALAGFGCKAGLIPLHIWLPGAHANAPSHVSALMSGVMIKMGIYGLVRLTSFFHAPPAWWGQTVLAIGVISALCGVVLAIAQHDIKRLLAYHSVENIGIILLGVGIALCGRSQGNDALVLLGMAGALLHVINHGLFKSLLFLSAGSVIHATGTRSILRYGGLWRTMPWTAFFFLGGAVAICGLPPLNGFVSEWLVYLGLFHTLQGREVLGTLFAIPGLAMTGGLALLCFAKVFGLSFLGTPRTGHLPEKDAPRSMLLAMGLLFCCCLWIGVAPVTVVPLLERAVAGWGGGMVGAPLDALAPAGAISLAALALVVLVFIFAAAAIRTRASRLTGTGPTWGCGYVPAISRVQYTSSSFAQQISDFFNWLVRPEVTEHKPAGLFPEGASCAARTPDPLLDRLLLPFSQKVTAVAVTIRHIVQHGVLGYYFVYFIVAFLLLFLLLRVV